MERLAGCGAPHVDAALGLTNSHRYGAPDLRKLSLSATPLTREPALLAPGMSRKERKEDAQSKDGEAGKPAAGASKAMSSVSNNRVEKLVQSIAVLIVDDNQYMRKVIRNILVNIGVKNIHEAADGIAGLEAIRMFAPDLVILDWEMPLLNGAELVRIVRSPGVFPVPDVPIIMLTGHVERWRVIEVPPRRQRVPQEAGVGQVSTDRIIAILTCPRAMVRLGDYYGPEPRKLFYEPMKTSIRRRRKKNAATTPRS